MCCCFFFLLHSTTTQMEMFTDGNMECTELRCFSFMNPFSFFLAVAKKHTGIYLSTRCGFSLRLWWVLKTATEILRWFHSTRRQDTQTHTWSYTPQFWMCQGIKLCRLPDMTCHSLEKSLCYTQAGDQCTRRMRSIAMLIHFREIKTSSCLLQVYIIVR